MITLVPAITPRQMSAGLRSRQQALLKILALGIKDYRQTAFKPYRVIYRVLGRQVVICLIADGRRDVQSVLARRLLGA